MATIEYQCAQCGATFQQVALKGEERQPVSCRECGKKKGLPLKRAESLFDGISGFCDLGSDTN